MFERIASRNQVIVKKEIESTDMVLTNYNITYPLWGWYPMIRLVPREGGTRFEYYFSKSSTETPSGLREQLQWFATVGCKDLTSAIAEGMASGKVTVA
jgi:hypothetical protein